MSMFRGALAFAIIGAKQHLTGKNRNKFFAVERRDRVCGM